MYKLIISELKQSKDQFITNWTVDVKCEALQDDADPNIFVFHAREDGDTYSNVASLYDMNTLPIGEPIQVINDNGEVRSIPFYRMDSVTMDFCNTTEAERFINHILKFDTRLLVNEYKAARNLQKQEEVVIS